MIFITSNLDKVRSNNFIVPCVSSTSEFQGVFAKEFQFDENSILEVQAYDCCSIKIIFTLLQRKYLCYN